jgi:outer membrane protein assembly factor BamB
MTKAIWFCLSLTLVLHTQAFTQNWPGFRGTGDSHSNARQLPLHWSATKGIAWQTDLTGYGQSSPVVWRDRIFLTSVQGANKEKLFAFCYDLKTGRALWQREAAATFTQKDEDIVSKAAPTPVVDGQRVYFFFESGDLLVFDHQGKAQWQRKLATEYGGYKAKFGLGSSLAQTDTAIIVLVVHGGASYLLAVDKQTGQNRWKTGLKSGEIWTTPLVTNVNGQPLLMVSLEGGVTAFNVQTGQAVWTVEGLKGNGVPSPTLATEQKLLIVGSQDRGMNLAIKLGGTGNVTASHIAWRANEATANFASPLVYRGLVYFVSKVGVAYCLDATTGAEKWRQRIGGECWTSPVAAGERIYFFTNEGVTTVVQAGAQYKEVAKNLLPTGRVYGVAAVDGALLLRSGRKLIKLGE